MLSSRSQNLLHSTDTENIFPSPTTRNAAFKTPRTMKRGRVVHDENSVYGHPKTAGLTGRKKNVLMNTPGVGGHLQTRLKTDKAPRVAGKSTALAEITNQTPFIKTNNPITPGPVSQKALKPFTILDDSVPPSARRISSTRKKARLPRSANKNFETPETRGDHWDVSDVSIEASVIEENSIVEEDYDDVEYAPPTAIEPKYDPGFDMPDYKEVGATLLSLFRQRTLPDDYDPLSEFDSSDIKDMGPPVWEKLELAEIPSDNIFPFMENSEDPDMLTNGISCSKLVQPSAQVFSRSGVEPKQKPSALFHDNSRTQAAKLPGKSAAGRLSTVSHTRIPSLTKLSVAERPLPATQPPRPVSHPKGVSAVLAKPIAPSSKTTSLTHARTASSVLSRPASVLSKPTSVPPGPASASRSRSITTARSIGTSKPAAKPISTVGRKITREPQPAKIPEDTILSLISEPTNGIIGEEFLFNI